MERDDIKMLVAKWWDIYNDESLDFKADIIDQAEPEGESKCTKRSSIIAAMLEPSVTYVSAPSAA